MQRPVRIKVFGILCLVMAGFSAIKNCTELVFQVSGPGLIDGLEDYFRPMASQADYDALVQQWAPLKAALQEPVYRVVGGIESALTLVMAGVLGFAAVGLLRHRLAGLRFARLWAMYALGAAVVTVVLDGRYLVPAAGPVEPLVTWLSALWALALLWLLPIFILTLLSRPDVVGYLRWRASQPMPGGLAAGQRYPQSDPAGQQPPGPPRQAHAPPQRPAPPPAGSDAWRDDPWNDPGSR